MTNTHTSNTRQVTINRPVLQLPHLTISTFFQDHGKLHSVRRCTSGSQSRLTSDGEDLSAGSSKSYRDNEQYLPVRVFLKIKCGTFRCVLQSGKHCKASASNEGDLGLIPGSGRCPGEGNGNPLQYSCLENPMDGGAW